MAHGPVYFSGIVDLKEDVTLRDVVKLYVEEFCALDDDACLEDPDWSDQSFTDYSGEVRFEFSGNQLDYTVDFSDGSYTFSSNFEDFLKALQPLSTKGWISHEGEPGDNQIEVAYGADDMAKAIAELDMAKIRFDAALTEVTQARLKIEGLNARASASQ